MLVVFLHIYVVCVVVGCSYAYLCYYQPSDWLRRLGVLAAMEGQVAFNE